MSIVRSDFAPAPPPPAKAAAIATATPVVVIVGVEVARTERLPPSAFTDEPSMYAATVSPSVSWASDKPRAAPASPPAREAATIVAFTVGVLPALTWTAPDASTLVEFAMNASI